MIKIIHISDFHLESENISARKKNIIKALKKDLVGRVDDNSFIFFTGDLIDKGGKNFKDSELSFLSFEDFFIGELLNEFPQLKNKIFVIPGNHDVFRGKVDNILDSGIKEQLTTLSKVDDFIDKNKNDSKYLERLIDYKNWELEYYKEYHNSELTYFENSFIVDLNDKKIGISCLNSSWLCKDENDKENILLGSKQIERSLEFVEKADFKIALMHHPLEFLKEFDRDESKRLLFQNYDVLLTGHVHKLNSEYIENIQGKIFISVANSTVADNPIDHHYVNGYSIIEFTDNSNLKVHYRKYLDEFTKFVSNTDIGNDNGLLEFHLLRGGELEEHHEKIQLVESLKNRFIEDLNDHIIMDHSNTNVRCSIDNIFVEPKILNNPQNSLSKQDTVEYTIESLLSESGNYILYGSKEAGKTLLIDKIFIDALNNYKRYQFLPILLKFSELKSKDLKRIFREYFSVSSSDINSFLENNNFLLLIDDIAFRDNCSDQIHQLQEFAKEVSNIRIIATSNMILGNMIPTDYLDYNEYFEFEPCYIQDFSSKEIKTLISKWFDGKNIDMQEKMEKLLKSFTDFKLPKNPLSVTLFLWIFERQEKKPINNSVLVELFVENILEKTNVENIYSDTFDFTNKKRLLSFIAKYMKDNGNADANYSISEEKLLNYISDYLKNKFVGKPSKILEDFIKRGVFSYEDDDSLRFKTAFMFHFFLSLQFDYDPTFKDFVMHNDNYLNYTNEIEYYTGLKRDRLDFLIFTQEKLLEAYSDFNEDIVANFKKIDFVLESKREKSLTFQIDDNKAKTKIGEDKLDEIFDKTLSNTPIQKDIPKKENIKDIKSKTYIDLILKLSSVVLKNSEDIDEFEMKQNAYRNVLLSSISFLMQYRDSLILFYVRHKKEPDFFPKNIDFHLFIRVLPLIHQNVVHGWLGSQKMIPVVKNKIISDELKTDISEFEKFMSVYILGDIRGTDYPEYIKGFVKNSKSNYIKDLSFLKIMSYYHLRKNNKELDKLYLSLMAEIKSKLGKLKSKNKGDFIKKIEKSKKDSN